MDDCIDSEASPNDADECCLLDESFSAATMHLRSKSNAPIVDALDASTLPPAALDVSGSVDETMLLTPQLFPSLSASLLEKLVRIVRGRIGRVVDGTNRVDWKSFSTAQNPTTRRP
jgi:hypothetical protein